MPAVQGEKLYGPPGPQNNAVLMDIISKLKHDLQQTRAENGKLVDQLNVLISLVKRAWSGEQAATLHLANIVGVSPPSFTGSELLRNTPVPDKTRAVKNWERLATRLLEKEYAAVQAEIKEQQKLYIERRQQYMDIVMQDHNDEMTRFNLQRQKNAVAAVQAVDNKFLRCYSAMPSGKKSKSLANRPRSAFNTQPKTASDMVEKAEISVSELIGQNTSQNQQPVQQNTNDAFRGLYRMSSVDNDRRFPQRRHKQFDDPNRYKQNNLFDPDVIFSPELMTKKASIRSRPSSASAKHSQSSSSMKTRPTSAVFITESKIDRPLKFETTRPVSGKPKPTTTSLRHRRNSAPSRRTSAPATFIKKELHEKDEPVQNDGEDIENDIEDQLDYVAVDGQDEEIQASEKPPLSVKVKKGHPMDKFMNDLRMIDVMEQNFKKSAIDLQKRLGIETDGIVY